MSDAIIRRLLASLDDYEGAQKAVVRWADLEQVIAIAQRTEKLQGELGTLRADLAAATARAEAAESALAAVDEYTTYYVLAWELFEEGDPEPLDFAEWLTAGKPEVQP